MNANANPFETPGQWRINGAEQPQPVTPTIRDGGEIIQPDEAFLRLGCEHFVNELKLRFNSLAQGTALKIVEAAWWSGASIGRAKAGSVNEQGDLIYTMRNAGSTATDLEENARTFALVHARSGWNAGYRQGKKSLQVGVTNPVPTWIK